MKELVQGHRYLILDKRNEDLFEIRVLESTEKAYRLTFLFYEEEPKERWVAKDNKELAIHCELYEDLGLFLTQTTYSYSNTTISSDVCCGGDCGCGKNKF